MTLPDSDRETQDKLHLMKRIRVHKPRFGEGSAFVAWLFSRWRADAGRGLAACGLDEGDALVCGNGSEIYQRGY